MLNIQIICLCGQYPIKILYIELEIQYKFNKQFECGPSSKDRIKKKYSGLLSSDPSWTTVELELNIPTINHKFGLV